MKMTSLEKRYVNRVAKGEANAERLRERLDALDLTGVADVLELGCGIGTVSHYLGDAYGWRVTGTDFDAAQVQEARRRYGEHDRLAFMQADATRLPFPDGSFDLVVSQNVFHHIPNWADAAREAARVLRPGGFVVWLDIVVPKPLRRLAGVLSGRVGVYTSEEAMTAFAEAGLEPRYARGIAHGPVRHHHAVLQKSGSAALRPVDV